MNFRAWVLLICNGDLCVAPSSYARLDDCVAAGRGVSRMVIDEVSCRHRDVLVPARDGLRVHRLTR